MKLQRSQWFRAFSVLAIFGGLGFSGAAQAKDLKCPRLARICQSGSPATHAPNSCKQICPEDMASPPNPAIMPGTPTEPVKPPLACPQIARICKNGSTASHAPNSCKLICPEDSAGNKPGLACPQMMRMCKDGSAAKQVPNSCKQICPEDRPGNRPALVCPEIARICKDGSTATHAPNSCKLICPEDPGVAVGFPGSSGQPPLACPKIARMCKDGSVANHAPDSCKLICPEDNSGAATNPAASGAASPAL